MKEEVNGIMKDYNIFMAMVERIGHDKRGNPIFRRDKYGNEILVPEQTEGTLQGEKSEGATITVTESKTKIIDDQTPLVAQTFSEWKKREGIAW